MARAISLISRVAFRVSIWLAIAAFTLGLIALLVGSMLPLFVSHAGELPMIDGPGVLDHGVCCKEPTWHSYARILPIFAMLLWSAAAILMALTGFVWCAGRIISNAAANFR
jgi:hypothetical protein